MFSTTKKIEKSLLEGKFQKLEEFLVRKSLKAPDFYKHLITLYIETKQYDKALQYAEKLTLLNPQPFTMYLYTISSFFAGKNVRETITNSTSLIKNHKQKKKTQKFLLGVLYLLEGNESSARTNFEHSCTKDFLLGHWGMAELLITMGQHQQAQVHIGICMKQAKDFPLIYLTAAKLTSGLKSLRLLHKYLSLIPISSEARYEMGMRLLELSSSPLLGRIFQKKALKHLQIKALLDSPKPENTWLYRLIYLYLARKGHMEKAAKWILIEQQVLYNTLANLEKLAREGQTSQNEEILDMIHSVVNILAEKEMITLEEFQKAYEERRETRLLEQMYQLSTDENEEREE